MCTQPTPLVLASLHAAAFADQRPWSAAEMQSLLSTPHVFVAGFDQGFVMGRTILDEAELLTIAVDPDHQGQGIGRQLLSAFEDQARARGAIRAFLEVAEDNTTARALYGSAGWAESGRRVGYYARQTGDSVDAILLEKQLPLREPSE
ncbi:N-acetyltransferase GCN5 [Aliiroseovarius zhejiangensis]|uniref:[Ribosomal protein bS18]-alanine N-acetyltransferase n=1 Tax=Aliiroseovarius zhejiangensis TaxID=1632025 RepID=A0ABQ3J2W0_9RHOB|nr:ribosomal protein S18-alanine N-acetyltransferase [Aliiroseovarius zhejiangensis]GHE99076.1 N-acetyltransferase GCN5 [Aliiroseovarius zhejiangensis]